MIDFCNVSGTVHLVVWNCGRKMNLLLLLQFYYGDINLARDKFLQEQIKLDDGCIFFFASFAWSYIFINMYIERHCYNLHKQGLQP